jgi:hypothetical protein
VTRVVKKTPARIPAAADIREKLLPDYLEEKSFTLAKEDATKFRDAVEDVKASEGDGAFDKVVKEKGITATRLAPVSMGALENGDVDYSQRGKDVSQFLASLHYPGAQRFPGMEPDPFVLKKSAVSQPIQNQEGKTVYIVRCSDRQLPTKADMGPGDYLRFKERNLTTLREKKCYEMIASGSLEKILKLERKSSAAQ